MRRLHPPELHELRELLAKTLHGSAQLRYQHRLHAVLLVSFGHSCYEVAHWFGDDPRSVERWVHAFEQSGDAGLRDHHAGGRRAQLTVEQRDSLAMDLSHAPSCCGFAHARWSAKLISIHVQKRFGVGLSERQCLRLRHASILHPASSAQRIARSGAMVS